MTKKVKKMRYEDLNKGDYCRVYLTYGKRHTYIVGQVTGIFNGTSIITQFKILKACGKDNIYKNCLGHHLMLFKYEIRYLEEVPEAELSLTLLGED